MDSRFCDSSISTRWFLLLQKLLKARSAFSTLYQHLQAMTHSGIDSTIVVLMLLSCVTSCIPFPHHLLSVTLVCCCCRLAIVGGGYIAAEQACIYRNFGADVHMFFRGKHILAGKHTPFNNSFSVLLS